MKRTIKSLPAFLFIAIIAFAQVGTDDDPFVIFQKGVKAFEEKNYKLYLELMQKAASKFPDHPSFVYHLARAQAATGMKEEALKNLMRSAVMGAGPDIDKTTGFESVGDTAEFKQAAELFRENRAVKGDAEVAFTIPQKDLIAEGMAYDPATDRFFVSSTYRRKIVEIRNDGKSKDFIKDKQDGIWGVVGMEVDAKRRVLWAAHGNLDQDMVLFDAEPETIGHTGVFQYDLASGKLLKKYLLAPDPDKHFFNDLAVAKNGDVYISDSERGCIYRIQAEKELQKLGCPEGMYFPNGISLSQSDSYLYIGHASGISVMDTSTLKVQPVEHPANAATVGVDGMVTYGDSIIVNQSFANVERVTRFYFGKEPAKFEKAVILQANHPLYNLPTTGVVGGKSFYYIANSQLRSFDEKGKIFPEDKLQETLILRIDL
jgi:hypothetical protein